MVLKWQCTLDHMQDCKIIRHVREEDTVPLEERRPGMFVVTILRTMDRVTNAFCGGVLLLKNNFVFVLTLRKPLGWNPNL